MRSRPLPPSLPKNPSPKSATPEQVTPAPKRVSRPPTGNISERLLEQRQTHGLSRYAAMDKYWRNLAQNFRHKLQKHELALTSGGKYRQKLETLTLQRHKAVTEWTLSLRDQANPLFQRRPDSDLCLIATAVQPLQEKIRYPSESRTGSRGLCVDGKPIISSQGQSARL